MAKNDDFGLSGERRGTSSFGRAPDGDQGWQPQGGVPGKRTAVPEGRPVDRVTAFLRRVDTIGGRLDGIAARHLPAMRAAITARAMDDARRTGGELAAALGSVDADLTAMKQQALLLQNAAALTMLAPLEARRDACRVDAAPLLAQVPPPAPALSLDAAFAPHLCLEELAQHDAAEAETRAAWSAELDAREDQTPAATNVIDAGDRFRRSDEAPAAVQRRTAGSPTDPETVHAHAAAGVAGTGTSLPHLATIQRGFGAHDVTGIRAHVGGPAADASAAIGAEAYATGTDVAFASSPSLFVAAHEAAHVVQQRAGVSLLGGVGEAGDAYEQHADAVAETVVRGESAEGLLGQARSSNETPSVQKKETPDPSIAGNPAPGPASTPADEERHRVHLEKLDLATHPMMLAELTAKQTLSILRGDDLAVAMERGLEGCTAIADHLAQIKSIEEINPSRHFKALTGLVYLITARLDKMGLGEASEVVTLMSAMALTQSMFSDADIASIESEEHASKLARHHSMSERQGGADALRRSIEGTRLRIDHAVDTVRSAQAHSDEDRTLQLGRIAVDQVEPLLHLGRTCTRNDVGADLTDEALRREVQSLRDSAQRLAYWTTFSGADQSAAEALRDASNGLLATMGLAPLVVKDGALTNTNANDGFDGIKANLKDAWEAFYDAQDKALLDLSAHPGHGKVSKTDNATWDGPLFAALGIARFTGAVGLLAGAAGSWIEDETSGGKRKKNATKTAAADVIKGLARALFEEKASTPVNEDSARFEFYSRQRDVIIDLKLDHQKLLESEFREAERSPDVRTRLRAENAAMVVKPSAIASVYRSAAVQDWALYKASQTYGTEAATGGVDLDGVGGFFEGALEDPNHHGRGIGVLELIAELGEPGTAPKILKAVVRGMRSDDAVHLTGLQIGSLELPAQIRGCYAYGEGTIFGGLAEPEVSFSAPPMLLVSRNREGTVWLSQATDEGTTWLKASGGDALQGAAKLFEAVAELTLGTVEVE